MADATQRDPGAVAAAGADGTTQRNANAGQRNADQGDATVTVRRHTVPVDMRRWAGGGADAPAPAVPRPPADSAARFDAAAAGAAKLKAKKPTSSMSPPRVGPPGFIEGKPAHVRTHKGTKEVVEVFLDGPPLTYWKREGGRTTVPLKQPDYIQHQMCFILKDGAVRWPKNQGDMVCANCFMVLTSDPSGCSNLKGHFKSSGCGRLDWIEKLKEQGNAGRRAAPAPSLVSALTYEEKMLLHVETALAFAQIGTLPAALLDHPVFIRLVGLYSRDSYLPPCARFIAADGPCLDCAEDGMIANQTAEMEYARVYYKGLPFACGCFDAWTSRSGCPFIGMNTTYLTPWKLTRASMLDPFEGLSRANHAAKLIHLKGRHTGARIASAVARRTRDFGVKPKAITLRADNWINMPTDLSETYNSMCTDSGGGVPAACRRLGRPHKACGLHGCDSTLLNGMGLAQKDPGELILVKRLMQKVFALAVRNMVV